MSSFLDIMREQEYEKNARQYYREEVNEDLQLEFAMQLSLQESQKPQQQPEDPDADLAYIQQLEEDEQYAYYLQKQHQKIVARDASVLKTLTPLETKIYNLKFGIDDPDRLQRESEALIEEETEYNYEEPINSQQKGEPPVLFDIAQRKEDKEIAYVPKRMQEKRINSIPVALHHKDFDKSGKGMVIFPSQKSIKNKRHAKYEPQNADQLPMQDEEHEYGLVVQVLGDTRYKVFCYNNCSVKICRSSGKMKFHNIWIFKGDIVLLKVRNFQDSKAMVVYKYNEQEYNRLLAIKELVNCDPKKVLTPDILSKVLSYLDHSSKLNFMSVYEGDTVLN